MREGEDGDAFYVITKGKVDVLMKKEKGSRKVCVAELGRGQFFGEKALLTNEKRNADCVAKTDVECLVVDKEAFDRTLGPLEDILRKTAQEFTSLFEDWSDIHEPKVDAFLERKRRGLEVRQSEYRSAQAEYKGRLGEIIDQIGAQIKQVAEMKKRLKGRLKARESVGAVRGLIRELLLVIGVGKAEEEEEGEEP